MLAACELNDQPRLAVDLGSPHAFLAPEGQQTAREELDVVNRTDDPEVLGALVDERAVERDKQRALARGLLAEKEEVHLRRRHGSRMRSGASTGHS